MLWANKNAITRSRLRRRRVAVKYQEKRPTILFVGSSNEDYFLEAGANATITPCGLHITKLGHKSLTIPLDSGIQPGAKTTVKSATTNRALDSGLFSAPTPGGCGFNVLAKFAEFSKSLGLESRTIFADSSSSCPSVDSFCARHSVEHVALKVHQSQHNLVIPGEDKIILREEFQRGAIRDTTSLIPLVKHADLTALIAPKSLDVCQTVSQYARRIGMLMITPSVPAKAIRLVGARANTAIGNLQELVGAGNALGLNLKPYNETGPFAARAAVDTLKVLYGANCAGMEGVCTLGRAGAVIANHRSGKFTHVKPLVQAEETPSGAGDAFAASVLLHGIKYSATCPFLRTALALADVSEWLKIPGDIELEAVEPTTIKPLGLRTVAMIGAQAI